MNNWIATMDNDQSHKDTVLKLISEAPGNPSIEDMMYLIYLQQKIEKGMNDFKNGNTFTNDEVGLELEKWLK